jgi:hypothetical protein
MPQELLAYFCSDFTEEDVAAFRTWIQGLCGAHLWFNDPPAFFQECDEAAPSCRARHDDVHRSVGVSFVVSSPGEHPATPPCDAAKLLEAVAAFSASRNVDFEILLDFVYVGTIHAGTPDCAIRKRLLPPS